MSYELSIPLKRATVELEFETVEDLERQLAGLDLARVDRLVAQALRPGRKVVKAAAKKGGAKKGASGKRRAAAKKAK